MAKLDTPKAAAVDKKLRRATRPAPQPASPAAPRPAPPASPAAKVETPPDNDYLLVVIQANSKSASGINITNNEVVRIADMHQFRTRKDGRGNLQAYIMVNLFDH